MTGSGYGDFSAWYAHPDGGCYGDDPEAAEACRMRVRRALGPAAEELLAGLERESQPACMHRFLRYQEVKLASIGALRWRGRVPADDGSRDEWQTSTADYGAALEAWAVGAPAPTPLGTQACEALGEPTAAKRAIVTGFLLVPPAQTRFFEWMAAHAPRLAGSGGATQGLRP